ncbi:MAG: hypothetical protein JO300_11050 [Silvibacterium sp.]|nr:hypothetical protein [Silvibacterium sp.]
MGDGTDMRPTRIASPDGHLVFHADPKPDSDPDSKGAPDYFVTRDGKRLEGEIEPEVDPEMAWSPDSKAFFITWSDGGAVGTFSVYVYLIDGGEVRKVDLDKPVRDDIARTYPPCIPADGIQSCSEEEKKAMVQDHDWVNVAGMKWMGGSDRLLVVGNVPDSSRYGANMGKWLGYEIEVPSGKILKRYSRREFRSRWDYLKKDWD